MDSELLSKYIDDLPNFKELKENSPEIQIESVFPPDSDTAWASIYTGLNPAEHGVVGFVDPLKKSVNIQTMESEVDLIRGKTFWDRASAIGKKVIVLLPHIAYPPWEVNGIMVSRSRILDDVKSYPPIFSDYELEELNSPKGVPRKDNKALNNFINNYKNLLTSEKKFFLKMLDNDWDLFFCYSSALDAIQHYFWNLCDENSPDYDISNPFKNTIKEFYVLYDLMIGEIIKNMDEDTVPIVLSDHGHTSRPLKLININEILRRNGFVKSREMNIVNRSMVKFTSTCKELIGKYNIGWIASKILKIFPELMSIFISNRALNFKTSKAYVTDLSGIKAYTYGGIIVEKDENYEYSRDNIIKTIKNELGDKIVFICKKEHFYNGKYISKYPDIILQLKEGYGLGNEINTDVFTDAYTSNIVPGSHRGDTPIFFINNVKIDTQRISLEKISSLILDLLGNNYK